MSSSNSNPTSPIRNAITNQPQPRLNAALTQRSRLLGEETPELNRILNLPCIIFRPTRQLGCSPKEYEVLEDRQFHRIFRGISLHGPCYWACYADPAITINSIVDNQEILQLQIDPHTCSTPTLTGTVSSPPGTEIGKAVHNTGWFEETFEMRDSLGNTVFLCDPRRRWNNRIPEFEITTTNFVTIGRISISIHSYYGEELTLRWFIEEVTPQTRILGLGFLIFLHLRVTGRYQERRIHRPIRRRSSEDYDQ